MATRTISTAEVDLAQETLDRARRAMDAIADFDQATVDRLCQAVAWATANLETSTRLANMSVDESGMGSREPSRRGKVLGITPNNFTVGMRSVQIKSRDESIADAPLPDLFSELLLGLEIRGSSVDAEFLQHAGSG